MEYFPKLIVLHVSRRHTSFNKPSQISHKQKFLNPWEIRHKNREKRYCSNQNNNQPIDELNPSSHTKNTKNTNNKKY